MSKKIKKITITLEYENGDRQTLENEQARMWLGKLVNDVKSKQNNKFMKGMLTGKNPFD